MDALVETLEGDPQKRVLVRFQKHSESLRIKAMAVAETVRRISKQVGDFGVWGVPNKI